MNEIIFYYKYIIYSLRLLQKKFQKKAHNTQIENHRLSTNTCKNIDFIYYYELCIQIHKIQRIQRV